MQVLWFVLFGTAFLLGNVGRVQLAQDIRFSVLDISAFLATLAGLWKSRSQLSGLVRHPAVTPALGFSAVALLSLAVGGPKYGAPALMSGFLYLVRWIVYSFLFLWFPLILSRQHLHKLPFFLGVVFAVSCIIQYLVFPDLRPYEYLGWDPHYYRVVGPLLDPGYTGLILVFSLLWLTFHRPHWLWWSLTYITFAFTYSRTSFLAFLSGMGFLSYLRRSPRIFLFAVALMALTVLLLPRSPDGEGVKLERTSSIAARIKNWSETFTVFTDHPVLGVGFNVYRYVKKDYGFSGPAQWQSSHADAGADSSLLLIAATSGILGLAVYLWYIKSLWHWGNPFLRTVLFTILVHSWFLNSLFYPAVMFWLALAVSLSSMERSSQ